MIGAGFERIDHVLAANTLLVAFAIVGIVLWLSNALSARLRPRQARHTPRCRDFRHDALAA